MLKRKILAAALLLSMPIALRSYDNALNAGSTRGAAWAYLVGMDGSDAFWYGVAATAVCSTISGPGGIACGVVAGG